MSNNTKKKGGELLNAKKCSQMQALHDMRSTKKHGCYSRLQSVLSLALSILSRLDYFTFLYSLSSFLLYGKCFLFFLDHLSTRKEFTCLLLQYQTMSATSETSLPLCGRKRVLYNLVLQNWKQLEVAVIVQRP